MAAVTICSDFGSPQNKVSHCFHCFRSISHEVMGPDAMILVFRMLSFKPTFSLSSFTFIKRLYSSSLSAIRAVSSAYLWFLRFLLAICSILNWLKPSSHYPTHESSRGGITRMKHREGMIGFLKGN